MKYAPPLLIALLLLITLQVINFVPLEIIPRIALPQPSSLRPREATIYADSCPGTRLLNITGEGSDNSGCADDPAAYIARGFPFLLNPGDNDLKLSSSVQFLPELFNLFSDGAFISVLYAGVSVVSRRRTETERLPSTKL